MPQNDVGHTNDVRAVAVFPDCRSVVTGSADDTAAVWEVGSACSTGGSDRESEDGAAASSWYGGPAWLAIAGGVVLLAGVLWLLRKKLAGLVAKRTSVSTSATPAADRIESAATPTQRFCGQCGSPNDPSARFCSRCGAAQLPEAQAQDRGTPDWPPHDAAPLCTTACTSKVVQVARRLDSKEFGQPVT